MKEVYHKYILAAFAAVISAFAGYCLGFVSALNWVIRTAVEHFGFKVDIDYVELANAIFRYKAAIGTLG